MDEAEEAAREEWKAEQKREELKAEQNAKAKTVAPKRSATMPPPQEIPRKRINLEDKRTTTPKTPKKTKVRLIARLYDFLLLIQQNTI